LRFWFRKLQAPFPNFTWGTREGYSLICRWCDWIPRGRRSQPSPCPCLYMPQALGVWSMDYESFC
jgi:hypothetical protein